MISQIRSLQLSSSALVAALSSLLTTIFLVLQSSPACADNEPAPGVVEGSVPRDGFDLHYRVVGDKGAYVVILAGGPGLDVDYMASVTDELAKTHRCVLLDQRGTGRSKLKDVNKETINWAGYLGDIEALRNHLKEDKIILLGHSWGMLYALANAAEYPEKCRGVATMGSCPITAEYMRLFSDNRMSRLHPSEREAIQVVSESGSKEPDRSMCEYLRAITPTDFYDRKKGVKHAIQWEQSWCHADVNAAANATIYRNLDLRPKLKVVTCPVLLVHGYQDVVGEANMLEAKGLLKDCTLKFVHRCGHYPWLDQPEETWKVVLPFLTKLEK